MARLLVSLNIDEKGAAGLSPQKKMTIKAAVAQLDRAMGFYPMGSRFES